MVRNRRDDNEMSYDRYYKGAFGFGWVANLVLWLLVLFVLIRAIAAPETQPFGVLFSFAAFIVLFVLFSAAFLFYLKTWSYPGLILTIIFIVGQFIIVLVTTITIFSNERIFEHVRFSNNPVAWIQSHRWLPILFSVVFLPLFLSEIALINHYAQSHKVVTQVPGNEAATDYERKATPYHSKQYAPTGTTE